MKDSFVLYTKYIEHVQLLSMEQRGVLLTAIFAFASNNELPDMDGMTVMAFSFIRSQLEKDFEKYEETCRKRSEAGKQGGRGKAKKANALPEKQKKQSEAKKADNDNEYDNDNELLKENTKRKVFSPPTVDDVRSYCIERKNNVDPQAFIDFYESKGWMIGKNRMKDWKACVRTWERGRSQTRPEETAKHGSTKFNNFTERNYDMGDLERRLLQ